MLTVSVSTLDLFRMWNESEDLDLQWLMQRLLSKEQTEQMKAGEAFHAALEAIGHEAELNSLAHGDYRFDFNCDAEINLTAFREQWIRKQYDGVLVRGRVDAVWGKHITDYKTTADFDPDRYMFGYQWRLYLDMTGCDKFTWKVFVMREFGPPGCYEINQFHELSQKRYPDLEKDCEELIHQYRVFAETHLAGTQLGLIA